jgi:hypothetical protein
MSEKTNIEVTEQRTRRRGQRAVRRTPITDSQIVNWGIPKKIEYVEAELARRLEVMCQELATELEIEMNPGCSCAPLREWKAMHDSPNAIYSRTATHLSESVPICG